MQLAVTLLAYKLGIEMHQKNKIRQKEISDTATNSYKKRDHH